MTRSRSKKRAVGKASRGTPGPKDGNSPDLQDHFWNALGYATKVLLTHQDPTGAVRKVLGRTIEGSQADRAVLFQCHEDPEIGTYMAPFMEVVSPGTEAVISSSVLSKVALYDVHRGLHGLLENGEVLTIDGKNGPSMEGSFFTEQGVRAGALAPVSTEDGLWGVLEVVRCNDEHPFSLRETVFLESIAGMIGASLQSGMTQGILWSEKMLFEQLFYNAREAIVMCSNDGTVQRANDEFLRLFGYEMDEVIDKHIDDLVAPEPLKGEAMDVTRDVSVGVTAEFETVRRSKDASHLEVSILASPIIVNDEQVGVYGIYRDIGDRKRTEEALRENEELLRQVVEGTGGGIWYIDMDPERPDTRPDRIHLSAQIRTFLGYREHETLNSLATWYKKVHPDDIGRLRETMDQHFLGKSDYHDIEYRVEHRDGGYVWLHSRGKIIHDEHFRPIRWAGMIWDVTDKKRAQSELMEERDRATLYSDLLSHDITNMNIGINGLMNIINEAGDLPKEARELVGDAMELSREISNLVRNVRRLREIEVNAPAVTTVDLNDVIVSTISKVRTSHPKRSIVFKHDLEPGKVVLKANTLLGDLFYNVIGNSLKHARKEEVNVDLTCKHLSASRSWRIEVSDNGPGIPDEMKDQIFFDVGGPSYPRSGKALGMSLVKKITGLYGGEVWVEDRVKRKPGKGCRFVFVLPEGDLSDE